MNASFIPDYLLIIDSECVLCSRLIIILNRIDRKKQLYYSSFTSVFIQKHFSSVANTKNDTLLFVTPNGCYEKSTAVFELIRYLDRAWRFWLIFSWFPLSWTNAWYDFIARNRYQWLGKTTCFVPPPDLKERFLA